MSELAPHLYIAVLLILLCHNNRKVTNAIKKCFALKQNRIGRLWCHCIVKEEEWITSDGKCFARRQKCTGRMQSHSERRSVSDKRWKMFCTRTDLDQRKRHLSTHVHARARGWPLAGHINKRGVRKKNGEKGLCWPKIKGTRPIPLSRVRDLHLEWLKMT